ncbi:MAG: hypothetical protein HY914_11985 [Desulfomonile tiedjei]|nr:hypothetical protein [Desulfomonile tiedjei]
MMCFPRSTEFLPDIRWLLSAAACLMLVACGYHFSGTSTAGLFPPDVKTIVLESVVNNTTVTGIETELTNGIRQEFALAKGLSPVRSGGDVALKTVIASYEDTPSMYKADGKELTRIGTLSLRCKLEKSDSNKLMWKKDLAASCPYTVTDTISETLTNRRAAISHMIKDLVPRIRSALYDDF